MAFLLLHNYTDFITFFIERDLSKEYSLQEKAKKMCFTLLPINIVVVLIFFIFIL